MVTRSPINRPNTPNTPHEKLWETPRYILIAAQLESALRTNSVKTNSLPDFTHLVINESENKKTMTLTSENCEHSKLNSLLAIAKLYKTLKQERTNKDGEIEAYYPTLDVTFEIGHKPCKFSLCSGFEDGIPMIRTSIQNWRTESVGDKYDQIFSHLFNNNPNEKELGNQITAAAILDILKSDLECLNYKDANPEETHAMIKFLAIVFISEGLRNPFLIPAVQAALTLISDGELPAEQAFKALKFTEPGGTQQARDILNSPQ